MLPPPASWPVPPTAVLWHHTVPEGCKTGTSFNKLPYLKDFRNCTSSYSISYRIARRLLVCHFEYIYVFTCLIIVYDKHERSQNQCFLHFYIPLFSLIRYQNSCLSFYTDIKVEYLKKKKISLLFFKKKTIIG